MWNTHSHIYAHDDDQQKWTQAIFSMDNSNTLKLIDKITLRESEHRLEGHGVYLCLWSHSFLSMNNDVRIL